MRNYESYQYGKSEFLFTCLKGGCLAAFFLQLFYDMPFLSIFGAAVYGLFYTKSYRAVLAARRRWELNLQFKEGIAGISSALQAGYSMENALRASREDLYLLYHGTSFMEEEFCHMEKQLKLNRTVESLFMDLAGRSGLEDIRYFSQVLITAKRMGGDMVAIIRSTVKNMSEKIEVKREIQTMVAGKKLEGKIMCLIPPMIIVYLRFSSPGFLNPLYHNPRGMVIMTVILFLYMIGLYLQKKILDFKV